MSGGDVFQVTPEYRIVRGDDNRWRVQHRSGWESGGYKVAVDARNAADAFQAASDAKMRAEPAPVPAPVQDVERSLFEGLSETGTEVVTRQEGRVAPQEPAVQHFQGSPVRILEDEDGEALFVAQDVARILGYATAKDMARRLDSDEKGGRSVPTPGGPQRMTCLTEAGLYSAILGSQAPAARGFKRWVTHEVLPAIHRTGAYSRTGQEGPTQAPVLSGPALLAHAVIEAKGMIDALAPKAEAWDAIAEAHGSLDLGAAGKALGIGRTHLFLRLREEGILIASGSMRNTPYARHMHHFEVRVSSYTRPDETEGVATTTRIKASSMPWLAKRLGIEASTEVAA